LDDALGHWSSKRYKAEQVQMLNLLKFWKDQYPGKREIILLGGDVHVGGHTSIKFKGEIVLRQLVSSAISNYVLPLPVVSQHQN
jgi:hypothetical protein